MTYLRDTDFHDTAYAVEVDKYTTIYRIEPARGTEDFREMERVYFRGHQIAFAELIADGEFGQWEHQGDEFDSDNGDMWAIVDVEGGAEMAPFRVASKADARKSFGDELQGVVSFGDVRDEVKRVALAVACDMVLIVGRWETLNTEVEYTHGLVCAVEYGDGFIDYDSDIELSLEQLFKENSERLVRSGCVVGVDGLKIFEGEKE
jgi:hypothetical protein|nr:MAG TPA: hypothetical protein [Caudoviricetes sp.]